MDIFGIVDSVSIRKSDASKQGEEVDSITLELKDWNHKEGIKVIRMLKREWDEVELLGKYITKTVIPFEDDEPKRKVTEFVYILKVWKSSGKITST
ncbi:hypothetical protein [Staphylococcus sp. HMSC14D01]|uniref:hypothetical protein n=1 Tax=Staphylococcus sp. HMSC14D01 TaxID=1581101 RepID=UPI0008A469CB|nr:hypothetical protein [Staphylococcus sp. HMSC14D01]OFV30459.1 hypothetical protein HMPREF3133_00190 [Staphylococcus sp. HMSC14D01]